MRDAIKAFFKILAEPRSCRRRRKAAPVHMEAFRPGISLPREVGCFLGRIPCQPCRCLALCFGRLRHPCPCTDSPFRHKAPDQQLEGLRLQAAQGFHACRHALRRAFAPDTPAAATLKAPQCGDAAACRHVVALPDWQPRTREDCVICMKNAAIASVSMPQAHDAGWQVANLSGRHAWIQ